MTDANNLNVGLRALPKMDKILASRLSERFPAGLIKYCAGLVLEKCRCSSVPPAFDHILAETGDLCRSVWEGGLTPVINATGIVAHTNLGRSPLGKDAAEEAIGAVSGYCTLEYDVLSGRRGDRYAACSGLLRVLTGAEDALVVNNNAAAVFLIASAFASGKDIIVSRGELVEIGGGFRVPEVIASAGAFLREVGTTNKTYASDYEKALSENTGFMMKVSKSNYSITGFTGEVSWKELPVVAQKAGVMSFYDAGSALFAEIPGIAEPSAEALVKAGYGLVSFSGDKLMGAVQCGVILGKKVYIDKLKKNPAVRMLRPDKITLAVLNRALRQYVKGGETPAVKMLKTSPEILKERAEYLRGKTGGRVAEYPAPAGGGSAPGVLLPGYALEIETSRAGELSGILRTGKPPVVACVKEGRLIVALRSVLEEELEELADALNVALISAGIRPRL